MSEKETKKRVNGKSKGNTFERKIATLFSGRFAEITGIESSFRRNQDSGSFYGGSNQKRIATHDLDNAFFGDIICPKSFLYSIECKHYRTPPTVQSIISENVSMWDKWISQAKQDGISSSKKVMLIVKYNNTDELVFLSEKFDIKTIFTYKCNYIYRLQDVLLLEDSIFFNSN